MNRSVSGTGAARIAIVGAGSPVGTLIRDVLAERRVDGDRVNLFAMQATREEVQLGEYNGEARLLQEPDRDVILLHDVIFLCEPGEIATDIARRIAAPAVAIDLVDAGVGRPAHSSVVTHPNLFPERVTPTASYYSLAHPLAMLISEVLLPIEQTFGIEEAVGTVLRPASDFGQAGVTELREQVVQLLNFSELPTETFGRQLAFNILNERQGPSVGHGLEQKIATHVEVLLGWERPRLALQLITAPMFFGHCAQIHLRLKSAADVGTLTASLAGSRFFEPPGSEEAATPLELSTENRISISPPRGDDAGGYWLWVAAGETVTRAARQAVLLAQTVADI